MKPKLYLCVEYNNGYVLERDLGESVTLEELKGYADVAQTMMADITQEVVDVRIVAGIDFNDDDPEQRSNH